jgi:hypothetical protein
MTDLPDDGSWTDLGHGVAWAPLVDTNGELVALLERHTCVPGAQGVGSLPLSTDAGMKAFPKPPHWALENIDPITIGPSVRCPRCGKHGWIRDGVWEPARDST